jgi:protein phosphatase
MKVLTKDKIRTHSQRSILNKCLGFNLFIQPDIFKQTVQNDDVIIMCSDGIWAVIEDDEFAELTESTRDPEDLSKNIGELALERDHDDNLSVIVVKINELQNTTTDEGKKGVMLFPRLFNRFVK